MGSSMNTEKAHEIAKQMTYRDAVYNALQGRCVPFKKATRIKLKKLLDIVEMFEIVPITDEMIQKTRALTLEELLNGRNING
jgi:hypothetical protein